MTSTINVYEVPELTQEEQARIDNAYNKGKRDYGYYDSQSEEYLTATEYGEIDIIVVSLVQGIKPIQMDSL